MSNLGRLQKVDLRDEWTKEDRDFTPWLAREENICLLGETLNMSLEVEQEERRVGRFSADILCKDTGSTDGGWVVIENQLETTDHSHLGQILTYAAGLEAKTCVWVAAKFHEEHRAAIDWLNEISGDDHQFFGLEIELWRIGDSPAAPKFNIVAKPNDWKREVGRSARSMEPAALTETKRLQLEFWEALKERLSGHAVLRSQKPSPQHWTTFSIGRSGMHIGAIINTREDRIGVELYLGDENANSYFEQLEMDKATIEEELDLELVWMPLPERRACRIIGYHQMRDLSDKSSWPDLQAWMISALEQMHRIFARRVKSLTSGGEMTKGPFELAFADWEGLQERQGDFPGILLTLHGQYDSTNTRFLAQAYADNTLLMIKSALGTGHLDQPEWAFPSLFLARHTLELYLKTCYPDYQEIKSSQKVTGNNHRIDYLLDHLLDDIDPELASEQTRKAFEFLKTFHRIDPKSMAFRIADGAIESFKDGNNGKPGFEAPEDEIPVNFQALYTALSIAFDSLDRILLLIDRKRARDFVNSVDELPDIDLSDLGPLNDQ